MAFTTFVASPFNEGAPFVLNSGGVTLATGFRVCMGDGTASPLFISTTGIGVVNGSNFRTVMTTLATANRQVNLRDADGDIQPEITAVLAADATNSTVTPTAVSGFEVPVAAGSTYDFEILCIVQSAATTTGVRLMLDGPTAQTSFVSYEIEHATGTTLTVSNQRRQLLSAFGTEILQLDSPVAATPFIQRIRGVLKTTGSTPAVPVSLKLSSEVAASTVTLMAGSVMRFRKIA
jgi:hypothetical protein